MGPDSTPTANAFAKTICSICYEDLKPIFEDLQSISICGHVFHELCLQQWLEYCPAGKKSSCPVCKQACSQKNVSRLYFQSIGSELTQSSSACKPSDAAEADALRGEVKKLEMKLSGLNSAFERQQQHLTDLNKELSTCKEKAKKAEALKEDALKEKGVIGELLQMKNEELARSSIECSRLQERSMALAKELAAIKLVSDVNLEEEEVLKLASVGGRSNKDQTIDTLKKALVLRNKSYKELIAQCNLLGRGETRSLRKLEKAQEKIKKLKARLQELERALEEKENEVVRVIKASSRTTTKCVSPSHVKWDCNFPPVGKCSPEDKMEKTVATITTLKKQTSSNINHSLQSKTDGNVSEICKDMNGTTCKNNNDIINLDLETDPFFLLDEDAARLSPITHDSSASGYRNLAEHCGSRPCIENMNNKQGEALDEDLMCIGHQSAATEMPLLDVTLEDAPLLPIKRESSGALGSIARPGDQCFPGGLFGPEGANRYVGKWCKRSQSKMSSSMTSTEDLIAVGADGRGGRIKVLRSQNQVLDSNGSSLWPKRCKYGAKQGGQSTGCLQIEHFFVKRERS